MTFAGQLIEVHYFAQQTLLSYALSSAFCFLILPERMEPGKLQVVPTSGDLNPELSVPVLQVSFWGPKEAPWPTSRRRAMHKALGFDVPDRGA